MKTGSSARVYCQFLAHIYERVHAVSSNQPWKGRLLAIPLGVLLLLTIPFVRFASTIEGLIAVFYNIPFYFFTGLSDPQDLVDSTKYFFTYLLGFLISPFTALFAGTAVASAMLADPIRSSLRFYETCKDYDLK